MKIKKKKGLFFTLTAILLVTLTLVFPVKKINLRKYDVEALRADQLNSLISNLENDFENALEIALTRATWAMIKSIENNKAIENATESYKELILNGTLNGIENDFMRNSTIKSYEETVKELLNDYGIEINFNNKELSIYQQDPFTLTAKLKVEISLKDKANIASWKNSTNIIARISIEDFPDPLWLANGKNNIIKKASYVDCSNFRDHLENHRYNSSNKAPSFLLRLENKTIADEYGIESFIKHNDCWYFDYIYFNPNSIANFNCSWSDYEFKKIDSSEHLKAYCEEIKCLEIKQKV